MALSNAGFVKRGQKELDNGNIPELEQDDDGTLTAVFSDGTCTRLAKDQALKESSCTCGASGMCRHRVMLILSYQRANAGNALAEAEPESAERWHPGQWQEELATLPESILKRAQQLADKGITVELFCRPNEAPSAKLPMSDVRFYSRSSIRFARCDCVDGSLCEHVALAVQAFTDAEAQQPGFTHLVWQTRSRKIAARGGPFDTPEGETCRLRLRQLSQLLWHNGVSQPPIGFEAAFTRAQPRRLTGAGSSPRLPSCAKASRLLSSAPAITILNNCSPSLQALTPDLRAPPTWRSLPIPARPRLCRGVPSSVWGSPAKPSSTICGLFHWACAAGRITIATAYASGLAIPIPAALCICRAAGRWLKERKVRYGNAVCLAFRPVRWRAGKLLRNPRAVTPAANCCWARATA